MNYENISNITVDSDDLIPKESQNARDKYIQVIPYAKNEANTSTE